MKNILRFLLVLVFCIHLPIRAANVTVFAAASLTDALKEIAKTYESKTGDKINYNLLGSNVLARQIVQGAPADIFFSADEAQMDVVAKAGLIDPATRQDLLLNTLVIVAPSDSSLANFTPPDLAKPNIQRIALADPKAVPAGVYAKAYLTKIGLWSKIERKVVPTANVRAALAAVESSDAEVGIVYKTDVRTSKSAKVIYAVPQADGPKITYPIARVKTSTSDAAKKFLAYLESPEAGSVFAHDDFLPSGH
jgi:molybdate transport system substrate-binding protein